MNLILLNIITKTIPKVPANEFEDAKLIIKPRNDWKNDISKYASIFVVSIIAFFLTDKINLPYVGNIFFFGGLIGSLSGIFFCIRAILVYKYYFTIFREEDIKKLEK